jgi:hypothetical protein
MTGGARMQRKKRKRKEEEKGQRRLAAGPARGRPVHARAGRLAGPNPAGSVQSVRYFFVLFLFSIFFYFFLL